MIELTDLQTITEHCICLLSYTEYLRREESTKHVYKHAEKLFPSLRKLFIASMMHNKQLICVSGLQGAGKTTLMKNFYGINDDFMNVSIGRGERIPVIITEGAVEEPYVTAIKIDTNKEGYYSKVEIILQKDEIINYTKGEDEKVMYIEITVPYKHTYNSGVSFMLLPGFEKNNEYWNNLIEFSVNSSDAAVFVFNETSFSNAENESYLKRIESKFGSNVIYAITGSDISSDDNAEVKKTCIDLLNVGKSNSDRVVCVGQYKDIEKNNTWIATFKTAIETYALNETQVSQKTNTYIYKELLNIKDLLYEILGFLNDGDDIEIRNFHNHALLKAFDMAIAKKREEFARNLTDEFEVAKGKSVKYIAEKIDDTPWYNGLKRSLFGKTIKDEYLKTQKLIKESLRINEVCLPDLHMGNAFRESIRAIDTPDDNSVNAIQLLIDTENDNGKTILKETQETKDALNDVCALVHIPNNNEERTPLRTTNQNKLVQAAAEVSTYYYGLTSYDRLAAEKTSGLASYVPAESRLQGKDVLQGADASKKFAIGLAGVMGVDVLADGSLNFISQIAKSCSIAMPYAAAAAALIVGAGGVTAIWKDLNAMKRSDFESAKMAVISIYDNINREALARFDKFTEKVREQIEDNLADLGGDRRIMITNVNAKIEVNKLLDLLDKMTEQYLRETHNVGANFSR